MKKNKYYALYLSECPNSPCYYGTLKELAESLEEMFNYTGEETKAIIKVIWRTKRWFDRLPEWEG